MSFLADLSERARALLMGRRADRELDEELRFHVERDVEERVRAGVPLAEARRQALAAFGGVEHIKDDVRGARGVQPLDELAADARFALRALRHNPGFTVAAVLVLGLGIGAATAAFTVFDAVLLRPLPFPESERLVRIYEMTPGNRWNISTADFTAIRDQQRSLEAFGAQSGQLVALSGSGSPLQITSRRVTSGWFRAYRVAPAAGRLVEAADEAPGAPAVAVMSHPLAESRLGGATHAVGRSILLDGIPYEVIGVMPPGAEVLTGLRADVWPALKMPPIVRRGPFWMQGIARLREGVTLEDAARDLAGISAAILPLYADFRDGLAKLTPVPLYESIVGPVNNRIGLFVGAVALVLLVSIANVATLVLVRASARGQELSVRMALGASRARLARLVLTESMVLVMLAGLVGVFVAALGMRLVGVLSPTLPRIAEVGLDARALLFAAASTLASGVLVSLSPVSGILAGRGSDALRGDAARAGTARGTNLVRGALVVAEFALALPLLLGAGLLLNSFVRLQRLDRGYDPRGAVSVSVSLPTSRYPADSNVVAFWERLGVRLAELPGVTSAGLSTSVPPDQLGGQDNFNLVDKPVPEGESEHLALWSYVTPGFFEALGVPLLEGRHFTRQDTLPVVLVSRAWAERFYPRERAVGKQLVQGGCYDCPRTTIIGVVGDVKYAGTELAPEDVYGPLWQAGARAVHVIARGPVGEAALLHAVSEAMAALDPDLPRSEATLERRLEASLADPARWTAVIGSFGTVAALLAALGVFGLMSYVVRQRRREIGVRLALGAEPSALTRLIVGRGMRYAALGIVIGLGLALLEARWLGALLFEVPATDPLTIVAVALVLALTALVACWIPGIRAARIKPLEVLSSE